MGKDVIIALDFPRAKETLEFLSLFQTRKPYVKIGMELFYSEGPSIVRQIKQRGHKIFLDLKLHDIPNTVNKAMRVLKDLGVDMLNVHAAGTSSMMQAALDALGNAPNRPLLIAVTQLTSTSQVAMQKELLIDRNLEDVVAAYAKNAQKAGLDGVVCSPLESHAIKTLCGPSFLTVTPGVRFQDSAPDDQTRITTPARAKELGSDYIVVGRPITNSPDPQAAYTACCDAFLS